jgi:hypothetical protein
MLSCTASKLALDCPPPPSAMARVGSGGKPTTADGRWPSSRSYPMGALSELLDDGRGFVAACCDPAD